METSAEAQAANTRMYHSRKTAGVFAGVTGSHARDYSIYQQTSDTFALYSAVTLQCLWLGGLFRGEKKKTSHVKDDKLFHPQMC